MTRKWILIQPDGESSVLPVGVNWADEEPDLETLQERLMDGLLMPLHSMFKATSALVLLILMMKETKLACLERC